MKLQLGEIREMVIAMPILLQEKLPVKTAYNLSRTYRELSDHVKDMESTRNGLLEKYGKKDEKGKVIVKNNQFEIEDTESYSREYTELAQQEVEVDFEGFTLKDFEGLKVSGMDLVRMGRLIKDEGAEKVAEKEKASSK